MKRTFPGLLAIASLLAACGKQPGPASPTPAASAQPGDELVGTWWDTEAIGSLEFRADRTVLIRSHGGEAGEAAAWKVEKAGEVRVEAAGKPAQVSSYEVSGTRLRLKGGEAVRECEREARADRERRVVELFRRFDALERERQTASGEARGTAAAEKENIGRQMDRTLRSLAGGDGKAQIEALRALIRAHAPDLEPAFDARLRERAGAARSTMCLVNLKSLAQGIELFKLDEARYPATMAELQASKHVEERVFTCPVTGKADAYDYVAPSGGDRAGDRAIQCYDRDPHPDGKRCVSLWDGTLLELSEDVFEEALNAGRVK